MPRETNAGIVGCVNRMDRYILRQLLWWTAAAALCLTCIVWLTQSLRFVEMIINQGLSTAMFLYLTMLLLPTHVALILPIALLIAVLITYQRMMSDSELVIMRAAGRSELALARPALVLAGAVTALGYALSLYAIPASFREFKDLQSTLRNSYAAVLLQEGVFNTVVDGITVHVRNRTPDGELQGIMVHDARARDLPVTMMAERGVMRAGDDGPHLILWNGSRQEVDEERRLSLLYFDRYRFELRHRIRPDSVRQRKPRERGLRELFAAPGESDAGFRAALRMEGHYRLASPLMALALVFVALTCLLAGEVDRRGHVKRVVGAVVCAAAIQAAVLGSKSLGERAPDAAALIYLASLVPVALCGYVLWGTAGGRRPVRAGAHVRDGEPA